MFAVTWPNLDSMYCLALPTFIPQKIVPCEGERAWLSPEEYESRGTIQPTHCSGDNLRTWSRAGSIYPTKIIIRSITGIRNPQYCVCVAVDSKRVCRKFSFHDSLAGRSTDFPSKNSSAQIKVLPEQHLRTYALPAYLIEYFYGVTNKWIFGISRLSWAE
jgi:hypothetical protein